MSGWCDSHKAAFCQMVQTYVVKQDNISPYLAADILYEAYRCRVDSIPSHLPTAVREFVDWQLLGRPKPQWFETPIGHGIA